MIKFQYIVNGVCLHFRQSYILTRARGLGSKELGSQSLQSNKYGCSRVKTSTLRNNNNNNNVNKLNNLRRISLSASTLAKETGLLSARTLSSCSQHYTFRHASSLYSDNTNTDHNKIFKGLSCPTTSKRQYSTSPDSEKEFCAFGLMKYNNKPADPPQPIPVNIFKQFMNKVVTFIIRREHDKNFSVESLLEGAKMAILTVSSIIAEGRFDQLIGLVEEKARNQIEFNCSNMSERKRRLIEMKEEDCSSALSISYLDSIRIVHQKKGEIELVAAVVLSCIRNSHDILPHPEADVPSYSEIHSTVNLNLQLCRYIFHKKLVKNSDNGWIVHNLEHYAFLGEDERL